MATFGTISSPTPTSAQSSSIVENYFVQIDQLSAHNTVSAHEKVASSPRPLLSGPVGQLLPYTPFILFALLFVIAFGILVMNRAKTLRNMTTALLLAIMAASIPTVISYIGMGTQQAVKAGPEEIPRNVVVKSGGLSSVVISWTTDAARTGAVRFDKKPLSPATAITYIANAQATVHVHSVSVDHIVRGQTYEFEILSGTRWYDNNGAYIQFTGQ
jgi:hypothetical protein